MEPKEDTATVFMADSVSIRGPKQTDGSFTVSLQVGEYQGVNLIDLLTKNNKNVSVVIMEVAE